jgi:RNA recognition motif-containing protein
MNIFVSNLNFKITDDNLKQLFEEYGDVVSAKVIINRATGLSKGFGFVEMYSEKDGNEAIKQLDQSHWHGKILRVSVAKPKVV